MKKRIAGMITAMAMLISVMPQITVNAAEDIAISNLSELESFRDDVNSGDTYEGKTVTLTADIDMSDKYGEGKELWESIGTEEHPFNGSFTGAGHSINVCIDTGDAERGIGGLFGYTAENAVIANLAVSGSILVNGGFLMRPPGSTAVPSYVGAIAAINKGTIRNCFNTADVTYMGNYGNAGGIAGKTEGSIINCYNTGAVRFGGGRGSNISAATDNALIQNCFYLSEPGISDSNGAHGKTAEEFASGEMTYLLNSRKSEGDIAWYQDIGTDDYPVLDNTHSIVLYDGEKYYNDTKENDKINAYITRDFSYYASGLTRPIVIKSYDELKALVGDWRSNTRTDYLLEQYPQSFFENSFLYIRYIQGGPSDDRYKINSIENIDDTINIELEPLSYGSSDGFLNWFLFAETDRSLLDCDFNIIFKDFITVDSNQYHEGRPTHDVDFLPEDNLKLDYMLINSADELQSLWRGEQVLSNRYANNPDRFFENYSLLFISWEEPQAGRTKAVSSLVYSDKSIDITLSDNYNKEDSYAVITDYSAVIPVSKTCVDNDVNINVRKINNNDLNNIAIKSITQTITAWQEKFYNVFFTMENLSQYSELIAAVYEDGKLVGINSMEITSDGFYSFSVKSESYLADNCKIFLWGSLDGMKPLREVIEHSL